MGILTNIAKAISFGIMGKQFRKIEKMVDDDPSLKKQLEEAAKANSEMKQTLSVFCKTRPNHVLCNKQKLKEKTKSQIKTKK